MRICLRKSDNRIIEMQSKATAGTLIQNAVNAGYTADQVSERVVTEAEYRTLISTQNAAEPPKPLSALEKRVLDLEAAVSDIKSKVGL